jgi:hypothetical protein
MKKNELAYLIGSHSFFNSIKGYFYSFIGATLIVLLLLIGLFTSKIVNEYNNLNHSIRKILDAQENLANLPSKQYEITLFRKTEELIVFKIYSVGTKNSDKLMRIVVAPKYEQAFLKEAKNNSIILSYSPEQDNKIFMFYPVLPLWSNILDELKNNKFELYQRSLLSSLVFFTPNFSLKKFNADSEQYLYMLLVPFIFFMSSFSIKKRRDLFLKYYNEKDLEHAERCTIQPVKSVSSYQKYGNLHSRLGQIYKVDGKDGVYVIYNSKEEKKLNGYLLKYEEDYFFIHEDWVSKNISRHS